MKTDIIVVSSKGKRMEKALLLAEKVAYLQELSAKSALHLRLLTEETMALMRSVTGEAEGDFWIESEDDQYEVHLRVVTPMTSSKRDDLLAISSTGKNAAAKGLIGRLRDFFDRGADEDIAMMESPLMLADMHEGGSSSPTLDWEWTMSRYERALQDQAKIDEETVKEAWDELEKSVIARVADDIKVAIRGRQVEMVILKKLA